MRANTACVIEVGLQDSEVHAWYYDLRDRVPVPRHRIARILRQVADQLDVHSILKTLLTTETLAFRLNMFGYDDDELNDAIITMIHKPSIFVQGTLDRSQAGGVHERKLLTANAVVPEWSASFAVGQSQTHQISHTKGGICSGLGIGFEGSTNWSASGEGAGISLKTDVANPAGFQAQNNTLLLSTNPVYLARFTARLDAEHKIALSQQATRDAKAAAHTTR
jgi:hypothetical protein